MLQESDPSRSLKHLNLLRIPDSLQMTQSAYVQKADVLLKDPVYSVSYRCQVCKSPAVKAYKLYSRTMSVVRDYLLLPEYHGIQGYQSVDYLNLSSVLCPNCLFSSNSEHDFILLAETPTQSGFQAFNQELRLALFEAQTERETILAEYKIERKDLERHRTYLAGFVSYLLGIHCCLIKLDHHLKTTIYDLGHYYLRAAHLAEMALLKESHHELESIVEELLQQSVLYFKESWKQELYSAQAAESTLYLICVILLYVGNEAESRHYFKLLDQYQRAVPAGMDALKLTTYRNKVKDLYYEFLQTED